MDSSFFFWDTLYIMQQGLFYKRLFSHERLKLYIMQQDL
jgi:hypothetical protein